MIEADHICTFVRVASDDVELQRCKIVQIIISYWKVTMAADIYNC